MKIINTKFKDLKIIKHNSFKDKRGFLRVTHDQKKINKKFITNKSKIAKEEENNKNQFEIGKSCKNKIKIFKR